MDENVIYLGLIIIPIVMVVGSFILLFNAARKGYGKKYYVKDDFTSLEEIYKSVSPLVSENSSFRVSFTNQKYHYIDFFGENKFQFRCWYGTDKKGKYVRGFIAARNSALTLLCLLGLLPVLPYMIWFIVKSNKMKKQLLETVLPVIGK